MNVTIDRESLRTLLRALDAYMGCDDIDPRIQFVSEGDLKDIALIRKAAEGDDYTYLHSYLYHGGDRRDDLHPDIHDEAMSLLDGYGKMDVSQLREKGLTWDWSHVRDSSADAMAECRAFIEGILLFKA